MKTVYTKNVIEEHLKTWVEAELAISTSQSYTIGDRTLTRANLEEVRRTIRFWETKLNQYNNGGAMRHRRAIPKF